VPTFNLQRSTCHTPQGCPLAHKLLFAFIQLFRQHHAHFGVQVTLILWGTKLGHPLPGKPKGATGLRAGWNA
jgi:hypothetical protein